MRNPNDMQDWGALFSSPAQQKSNVEPIAGYTRPTTGLYRLDIGSTAASLQEGKQNLKDWKTKRAASRNSKIEAAKRKRHFEDWFMSRQSPDEEYPGYTE